MNTPSSESQCASAPLSWNPLSHFKAMKRHEGRRGPIGTLQWSVSAFTDSVVDAQKVEAAGAQNASVLMIIMMFPASG